MTQDEIIRMAREAGANERWGFDGFDFFPHELERFAALVAAHEREKQAEQEPVAWMDSDGWFTRRKSDALLRGGEWTELYASPVSIEAAVLAEREACAKLCENLPTPKDATTLTHIPTLETCAAAIRARGENASS